MSVPLKIESTITHTDRLPRVLVRDDGSRYTLNPNGTYSREASLMGTKWQYSLARLVNTGQFKIETP